MTNKISTIDTFINQQVADGTYTSIQEAQKELIIDLAERDLDQKIFCAREAAAKGKTRELTAESNQVFLKKMEEKLFAH